MLPLWLLLWAVCFQEQLEAAATLAKDMLAASLAAADLPALPMPRRPTWADRAAAQGVASCHGV